MSEELKDRGAERESFGGGLGAREWRVRRDRGVEGRRGRRRGGPRLSGVVFGLALLGLGLLFLLDNLGTIEAGPYLHYWPVLVIAFGLAKVLQPDEGGGKVFGAIVATIGTLFLLKGMGYIRWSLWALWPLALVALGLATIGHAINGTSGVRRRYSYRVNGRHGGHGPRGSRDRFGGDPGPGTPPVDSGSRGRGVNDDPGFNRDRGLGDDRGAFDATGFNDSGNTLDVFTVLGGGHRGSLSKDFRGGKIKVIMAGCEIDLRQASIAAGEATLDVYAFMGGVDLRVPEQWNVVVSATPFMGGVSDRTRKPDNSRETLYVTGQAILSGVDLRN